jgi:hypothetical protein
VLGSALTTARVGYFLARHREEFCVEERHLRELRARAPVHPRYFYARAAGEPALFVEEWNLVVPEYVHRRGWEEDFSGET